MSVVSEFFEQLPSRVDPGKTATFTAPKQAGAYPFHCNIHTDMHATLTGT